MTPHFKRLIFQIFVAVSGLLTSAVAVAENCYSAYVSDVAVDNNGTLWLRTSNVPLNALCNINTKGAFTMDVNSCNAAFAMLVSAKIAYRPVSVQYASGTCAAPGNNSAYYVQLN